MSKRETPKFVDLPAVFRTLVSILNHCQLCGREIERPPGVDGHTAKFNLHRCQNWRKGGTSSVR